MIKKKTILILPAYQASKTLRTFLNSIPENIFDEIILVDDCSKDNTFEFTKKLEARNSRFSAYQTPRNLGYGGNLKACLSIALAKGASTIVELHPDGEYGTDGIVPALKEIKKGALLVLGNRFNSNFKIPNGMYWWKFLGIRFLNWLHNKMLEKTIPDLHQGFRVYTKELLEKIDYRSFRDDYLFSFEIILAAIKFIEAENTNFEARLNSSRSEPIRNAPDSIFHRKQIKVEVRKKSGIKAEMNYKIISVAVTASYKGKKRGASIKNSILYSIGTFYHILKLVFIRNTKNEIPNTKVPVCPICQTNYFVTKTYLPKYNKFNPYRCSGCRNGFTYPLPMKMDDYYPLSYWQYKGLIGVFRKIAFTFFQKRRARWVKQFLEAGSILDIGSGEGEFQSQLQNSKFKVQNLEPSFSNVQNPNVLKVDFPKWESKKTFDAICFWESLEHVPSPRSYLQKAHSLLKNEGLLFIEYPRNDVIERYLFRENWFHLDIPRHMTHFSQNGLLHALKKAGFAVVWKKSVMSFEYSPFGLYFSIINFFSKNNQSSKIYNLLSVIFSPLLPLCVLCEIILYIFDQAPIGLFIAKRVT